MQPSNPDHQTTRPLTEETWLHWQKLVGNEHDWQCAEIERLKTAMRAALNFVQRDNPEYAAELLEGALQNVKA